MNRSSKSEQELGLDQMRQVLKQSRIKLTPQRLEVYKALMGSRNHDTVEEVYSRVRRALPNVSLDTLYRTLATFEELGLITRAHILDDRRRIDPNLVPHHHIVCTRCSRIEDFYWPGFDNQRLPARVKSWGKVHSRHLELRGLCRECSKGRCK